MHILKHFHTITKHRHKVMRYCFSCGLYKQGLLHDLSKYSITEFKNGCKFYAGIYSPHHNERLEKGYSEGWMHHKGRNKHHAEYWIDMNLNTKLYEPVEMPNRYIAESICDRIAASKIYRKKEFVPKDVLDYFQMEKAIMPMHEHTKELVERLLILYVEKGQSYIFKYIKKNKKKPSFGFEVGGTNEE